MKKVPHAADLVAMGLAHEVIVRTGRKGSAKIFRISAEGYELIRRTMEENALEARAAGSADWVRPPSSGHVLPH